MTIICVTVWKTKPVRGPGAKVEDEDDDVMPDGTDINEGRDCSVKPQANTVYHQILWHKKGSEHVAGTVCVV